MNKDILDNILNVEQLYVAARKKYEFSGLLNDKNKVLPKKLIANGYCEVVDALQTIQDANIFRGKQIEALVIREILGEVLVKLDIVLKEAKLIEEQEKIGERNGNDSYETEGPKL